MESGRIGIAIQESSPSRALEVIIKAEALGVPAVWVTTGGAGPDGLTLIAAAAARTKVVRLGTAIVPTFPRHPLVAVQQAEVIADIAGGRLVLGIGPSHQPIIVNTFGLAFDRPLEHLREYVSILKAALHEGAVNFDGVRFHVHAQVPVRAPVPVMISALRSNSFRLAGEVADGAITWICPPRYIRDVGLPALRQGAAQANRAVPPLIGHCFVALSTDHTEVRRLARERLSGYARLPFYNQMFAAAGYPEGQQGSVDALRDAVVIHGDETAVAAGLRSFADTAGTSELIVSLLPMAADAGQTDERAMRLIASL